MCFLSLFKLFNCGLYVCFRHKTKTLTIFSLLCFSGGGFILLKVFKFVEASLSSVSLLKLISQQ